MFSSQAVAAEGSKQLAIDDKAGIAATLSQSCLAVRLAAWIGDARAATAKLGYGEGRSIAKPLT